MGLKKTGTKRGMGGSRNGRGRSEKTAVMKMHGKKHRRANDKIEENNFTLNFTLDEETK